MARTRKTTKRRAPQKMYKMKGCSKTKRAVGGSGNIYLAYPPTNVSFSPNPHLAYMGKGGTCGLNAPPISSMNVNTNGGDRTMPNTGPVVGGFNFLNSTGSMRGGCGDTCSATSFMKGGKKSATRTTTRTRTRTRTRTKQRKGGCGPTCVAPLLLAGGTTRYQQGGNPGIPYPNGLAGSPWTPSSGGWPGVDGVQGGRNHIELNTYNNDISRQMIDIGANPPFTGGRKRAKSRTNKQRGGNMSNFLTQDLINLGRQVQFGVGSAYNALSGYSAPVNPLPWKDQYK